MPTKVLFKWQNQQIFTRAIRLMGVSLNLLIPIKVHNVTSNFVEICDLLINSQLESRDRFCNLSGLNMDLNRVLVKQTNRLIIITG